MMCRFGGAARAECAALVVAADVDAEVPPCPSLPADQGQRVRERRCRLRGVLRALVSAGTADEEVPVMKESSQSATVVALLADPDAPTEVAQRMARILPARLADKSDQGRQFDVEVISDQ